MTYTAALLINIESSTYTDTARKTHGARLDYVISSSEEEGYVFYELAVVNTKEEAKAIVRNGRELMNDLGYTRVTR